MAARRFTFASGSSLLRLVRRQHVRHPNAVGDMITVQEPVRYDFRDGLLTVEEGQDVLPDGPGGREQDVVAWLRSHPALGRRFHELGVQAPPEHEFLLAVNEATARLDEHLLRQLMDEEREAYGRGHLLELAERALETVQATLMDASAQEPELPVLEQEPQPEPEPKPARKASRRGS